MSVIKCSDSKFQDETFFVLTSNKKTIPPKNNSLKFDIIDEILTLPNSKIPDFDQFRDSQKNIFYFIDGSKNVNEFSIFNNMPTVISEDTPLNYKEITFSIEQKSENDVFKQKQKEEKILQLDIHEIKSERDSLKREIMLLLKENDRMKEEFKQLSLPYEEISQKLEEKEIKFIETPIKESHFNQKVKISTKSSENAKSSENSRNIIPKKLKDKNADDKAFYTPKKSNKKKIVLPKNEAFKTETKNDNSKKIEIAQLNNSESNSDEENIIEENPRPFPGKFAAKKFNSLFN